MSDFTRPPLEKLTRSGSPGRQSGVRLYVMNVSM